MVIAEHIYKTYNKGKANAFEALKDISFTIGEQELIAITGKSGAGKSTLLHLLGCIETLTEGSMQIGGVDLAKANDKMLAKMRNEKIGIVLQDFALIADYTVLENVMVPLLFAKMSYRSRKKLAMEALETIGIVELAKKNVTQLSGGQRQRVAIARAIVNHPGILLADEPTGALDESTGQEIMGVFQELHRQGHTVMIVTHDAGIAQQCNRILHIADGKIVEPKAETP